MSTIVKGLALAFTLATGTALAQGNNGDIGPGFEEKALSFRSVNSVSYSELPAGSFGSAGLNIGGLDEDGKKIFAFGVAFAGVSDKLEERCFKIAMTAAALGKGMEVQINSTGRIWNCTLVY